MRARCVPTSSNPTAGTCYLYGDFEPAPAGYRAPAMPNGVYQRRWNPLRREWVLVAASRQARRFYRSAPSARSAHRDPSIRPRFPRPAFRPRCSKIDFLPWFRGRRRRPLRGGRLHRRARRLIRNFGRRAAGTPAEVWTDRYRELSARRGIKYVFIFENRGEQVGVTCITRTDRSTPIPSSLRCRRPSWAGTLMDAFSAR